MLSLASFLNGAIPIAIKTTADGDVSRQIWEESRGNLEQFWRDAGYEPSFSEEDPLSLGIPLILESEITVTSHNVLQISSSLIHTVDGSIIGTIQSGGSIDLGAVSKWSFIVRELSGKADVYPLVYPEVLSGAPVSETPIETALPAADERAAEIPMETVSPGYFIDSMDLTFRSGVPAGRYRDFSPFSAGLQYSLNTTFEKVPVLLAASLAVSYELNSSPYIDHMFVSTLTVQAGYTFMRDRSFQISPVLSFGLAAHLVTGDLNTLEDSTALFYMDQYYGGEIKFSWRPVNREGRPWPVGFVLSPGFYFFPGDRYWGFQVTIDGGIRIYLR